MDVMDAYIYDCLAYNHPLNDVAICRLLYTSIYIDACGDIL